VDKIILVGKVSEQLTIPLSNVEQVYMMRFSGTQTAAAIIAPSVLVVGVILYFLSTIEIMGDSII